MSSSLSITRSLRLPRGLLRDLEDTVIQQDRLFLAEVARTLGLPTQEVIRRCLGTGAPQPTPVLWAPHDSDDHECCPWWEMHGDGLWRRCPRMRLCPTLPCQIHERSTPCPLTRLNSDPHIRNLPRYEPVSWNDEIYWMDPTGEHATFREDGSVDRTGTFRYITHEGERICVRFPFKENNPDAE